ncbi:Ketol-acid reductoisomerase (NADP(+)) [Bienertia sinuspersici]
MLNTYAHVREGEYVEVGVVVCDNGGKVLAMAAHKRGVRWGPDLAEAATVVFGVKMAMELGYMKIHLECDALCVATAVGKGDNGCSPIY